MSVQPNFTGIMRENKVNLFRKIWKGFLEVKYSLFYRNHSKKVC